MKKPLVFALIVLIAATMACSAATSGSSGAAPTPSNVLFQDDFSSTSSGWDSYNDADGSTDYANGGYRIFVNQPKYAYWSNPGLGTSLPGDLKVEVDATKTAGPDDNSFGVICRYSETDSAASFYRFMVSSDGYYGIILVNNSDPTVLTEGGQLLQSDAIQQGAATNHVTATCIGNKLTLFVNGTQVDSVEDSTLTTGDVGLFAGTFDTPGADMLFDNFLVSKP